MSIVVSAPGKVILFGDHSVVYNRRAIAAAISLRTTLTFTAQPLDGIELDFPDINLALAVPSQFLVSLFKETADARESEGQHQPPSAPDTGLISLIEGYLTSQALQGVSKVAATAFLYLYAYLGYPAREKAHGSFHLSSELPIGAGLGSSASVSVIIVTSLLLISGVITRPATANQNNIGQSTLELINRWAYVGEQCIHGTPSGVDNTVATYGKAVAFQKMTPMAAIEVPSLPLLLTNTGIPRSTKDQVAKVAKLKNEFPAVVEPILDAMHQIALEAQTLLPTASATRGKLGSLMVVNQGLLATLGVSHPSIESVIAENATKGWSKLIGAGGGGCVISLLNEANESLDMRNILSGKPGMESYMVSLGGPGVGYHTGGQIEYYAPSP